MTEKSVYRDRGEKLLESYTRFAQRLRESFDETFGERERAWLDDQQRTLAELWHSIPEYRYQAEAQLQQERGAEACAHFAPVIAGVVRRFRNIGRVRRFCENLRATESKEDA